MARVNAAYAQDGVKY